MIVVVLTAMQTEAIAMERHDMDSAIAAGEPIERVKTETWRLEFASERDFEDAMAYIRQFKLAEVNKLVTM